ncbi:endonuclease/exonuclease/phosphatase family protein [Pedobacter sp. UC225_61]|uniref:endonuclease/exonuclease/phosphatase family protein n=1 Tax=Pedobacter sp. UC225_61 TaxID=3374623 RepID=UPI0037A9A855
MKIITWNCNMAFRKKAKLILSHQPDILVIPECEHPDKINFDIDFPKPKSMLWFGKNQNKGLGIFSYNDFELTVLDNHNENLRMIAPIRVNKGDIGFNLFAIWANNPEDKDGQYVEQVWKAIHHYDFLISQTNTILIGDFNSNTIWDNPRRIGNHSAVVKRLEDKGIYSVYHSHYKQIQGLEAHPTLYLYRHQDKRYHLDYCFVSEDFLQNLQAVEIGEYEYWTKYSDHVPIIVTFKS